MKRAPILLMVAGLAAVAIALGADALLGRQSGFGLKQALLLGAGLALTVIGGFMTLGTRGGKPLWGPDAAIHTAPMDPLELGLFFGLFTGLVELAITAVRVLFLNEYLQQSFHIVWMAPLADVMLFGALGLLFTALSQLRWLPADSRIFGGILAFLSALSLLLLFPKVERLASVVLAAGVAVQVSQLLRSPTRSPRAAIRALMAWPMLAGHPLARAISEKDSEWSPGRRDMLIGTGATIASLALGTTAWDRYQRVQEVASAPKLSATGPNVLLIVLDTVRAQSLSLFGYERSTSPNLEKLAARGAHFEWAMSTAPWTLPSHASLFTGFYPHQLSSDPLLWFGAPNMTLAEALQSQGYVTAGFAANLAFCAQRSGIARGFSHYEDYPVSVAATLQSSSLVRAVISEEKTRVITQREDFARKSAADINHDFLNWQKSVGERPFFAFLNFFDAHDPYQPPEKFYSKFATGRSRGYYDVERGDELTTQDLRELRDAYDGSLAYLDHQVGLLLTELESRGVLDQTLLIVTSDHGEQFGEHGLTNHVNSLYLPLLHVPLLLHWPGKIPAGFRSGIPVSLRNLPATIVEMLGLDGRLQFPGEPLSRFWSASGSQSERSEQPFLSEVRTGECLDSPLWYPARRGSMRSLTWSSLHYIKNFGDGQEELYDFVRDPQEQLNLTNNPSRQSDLAWLRGQLETYSAI